MVVLDGSIYQARSDGTVNKIVDDTGAPFAIVVKFAADRQARYFSRVAITNRGH
jgi:acetolactate decarboxylase